MSWWNLWMICNISFIHSFFVWPHRENAWRWSHSHSWVRRPKVCRNKQRQCTEDQSQGVLHRTPHAHKMHEQKRTFHSSVASAMNMQCHNVFFAGVLFNWILRDHIVLWNKQCPIATKNMSLIHTPIYCGGICIQRCAMRRHTSCMIIMSIRCNIPTMTPAPKTTQSNHTLVSLSAIVIISPACKNERWKKTKKKLSKMCVRVCCEPQKTHDNKVSVAFVGQHRSWSEWNWKSECTAYTRHGTCIAYKTAASSVVHRPPKTCRTKSHTCNNFARHIWIDRSINRFGWSSDRFGLVCITTTTKITAFIWYI